MQVGPSYSERSALADARTSASTMVLAGVVLVRAIATAAGPLTYLLLAVAGACGVVALWASSTHYHWREDPIHRVPRPWVAFLAIISVVLSCGAGLSLTFTDLETAFNRVT